MNGHRRMTFLAIFFGSALLHAAVIARLSVPPPSPLPPSEQVLVLLSPAPQPEPEPTPEPVPEVPPSPAMPVTPTPMPVEDAAIPDESIPPMDPDHEIAPTTYAPPPPDAQESPVTLPVAPSQTLPGDPTNETIVRAWLERHKRYPRISVLRREEGEALLYLRLAPDGTVLRAVIRTSSMRETLDREVLRMVERSAPFPLTPATQTNTEYLIPIEFRLE